MQDDSANKLLLFGRACVLGAGFGLLVVFFFLGLTFCEMRELCHFI